MQTDKFPKPMKRKIFAFPAAVFVFAVFFCQAQSPLEKNPKIKLPDIPGYMTLKGDFHMHTVFSDGHVWPSLRVREAQRDGLDIISVTEHMDYEGFPDEVKHDLEQAFAIAEDAARSTNVVVIRGVEISPRIDPFHNNAIFLKDVNKLPFDYMEQTHKKFVMKDKIRQKDLMAPFLEVKRQNGFVFYNHPGAGPREGVTEAIDKEIFTDFHKKLLADGVLGGVEVVNGGRYNIRAHQIAEKYNLTLFANSDAHHDIAPNDGNSHRPMTLVFARSKSLADIEEAIRARRTAIYFKNYIIGRPREVEPLFEASLSISTEKTKKGRVPQLKVKITNNSDVPYEVKCTSGYLPHNLLLGLVTLEARKTTEILLDSMWDMPEAFTLDMEVRNIAISPDEVLRTSVRVEVE